VPDAVVPQYGRACIAGIVPAVLGATPSEWLPSPARGARATVLLVLDGLGWWQLRRHERHAPLLAGAQGGPITSVAPTTTVAALASIATGVAPGEHGLVGYRMDLDGRTVQMLRWADARGDVRALHPPDLVQPVPPFLGGAVPVISKAEFEGTGFTQAHLRGGRMRGWRAVSSVPVLVREALEAGETFVYAYYDGVDKVAHERGFGEFYEAELRAADRLVADVLSVLPPGCALLVTADHGQVHVGERTQPLHAEVLRATARMSGEGRFRWLHARPGAAADLADAALAAHGGAAWVVERDDACARGWFGPRVSDAARRRLGDVAVVPFEDVSFDDPDERGDVLLECRHGSLTAEEMDVPLLAFAP